MPDEIPTTGAVSWPRLAGKCLTTLIEVECMCNEHRDDWTRRSRCGDDSQYQLAIGEAVKWETVAAFIRAVTGGAQNV